MSWLRTVVLLAVAVLAVSEARADEAVWADAMFPIRKHDFGVVARGAKAEYRFVFTNLYKEAVHVASVKSSCACTRVQIEKPLLRTHERGAIVATINSRSFTGPNKATLTVKFDRPFPEEVQLHVNTLIRGDVRVDPDSVQFGSVESGTLSERTVNVTHAGNRGWKILDIRSINSHLSVKMAETRRAREEVAYRLSVRLDGLAPPGHFRDYLLLVTNDRDASQVPVSVEGIVQPGIVVSPESLFMGVVKPGQEVTKQLVVRGKRPFRILSVTCDSGAFRFENSPELGIPKPLHLIPVTFVGKETPGKVFEYLRIQTDLGPAGTEPSAYAVVASGPKVSSESREPVSVAEDPKGTTQR